jgi:hypothetical protein
MRHTFDAVKLEISSPHKFGEKLNLMMSWKENKKVAIFLVKLVAHMILMKGLRSWHVNSGGRVDQDMLQRKREERNVFNP